MHRFVHIFALELVVINCCLSLRLTVAINHKTVLPISMGIFANFSISLKFRKTKSKITIYIIWKKNVLSLWFAKIKKKQDNVFYWVTIELWNYKTNVGGSLTFGFMKNGLWQTEKIFKFAKNKCQIVCVSNPKATKFG